MSNEMLEDRDNLNIDVIAHMLLRDLRRVRQQPADTWWGKANND